MKTHLLLNNAYRKQFHYPETPEREGLIARCTLSLAGGGEVTSDVMLVDCEQCLHLYQGDRGIALQMRLENMKRNTKLILAVVAVGLLAWWVLS